MRIDVEFWRVGLAVWGLSGVTIHLSQSPLPRTHIQGLIYETRIHTT